MINDIQLNMRSFGSSLSDKCFMEVDLSERILWVNQFTLNKLKCTLDEILKFSLSEIILPSFSVQSLSALNDNLKDNLVRFFILPIRAFDGEIVWIWLSRHNENNGVYWIKGEYLNKTKSSGVEFSQMCITMETLNGYNDLHRKMLINENWTKFEVERINEEIESILILTKKLQEGQLQARHAAEKAANIGLDNAQAIQNLKISIEDEFNKQTVEILRLMKTDKIHDKKLEEFDKHMNETTKKAVSSIVTTAKDVGDNMSKRADRVGRTLQRKITIPVGVIAAIMTVFQWMIQHCK